MTSPTPSRRSSSTNLSKTTAHDLSHTATTVHTTAHHQHTHSDATQVDTVKISMGTFGDFKDDAKTETDSEPVGIYSLAPCARGDSSSTSNQHDTEKGEPHSRRHSTQAQDDTRSQNDTGPLCTWAELPPWMQDNPAIMASYRRPTYSYRKALRSLGYLHNESGEFWRKHIPHTTPPAIRSIFLSFFTPL